MSQELLKKENIYLNCKSVTRQQAIIDVGSILVEQGYVTPKYLEGMLRRDNDLSVYIGNMIAIPHGDLDVRSEILSSGIVVRIYPDGIDWGKELVKVVIGIAAIHDQHMKILSNCAIAFEDIESVNKVVNSNDIDWIHSLLVDGM